MRNRINRMITYRIPEQASISKADFHRLATRICEGTEQAKELFKLFLKTGSEVDCVICNNDTMALGVVEACKEAGIDLNSVPVVGVDATADGCQSIQNGDMAFTVYQSGSGQGSKAVEMAINSR